MNKFHLERRLFSRFEDYPEVARDLRESMLQEPSDVIDDELLMREISEQICFALAYGPFSPWRIYGFMALVVLCNISSGRMHLQHLEYNGTLMQDIAKRIFQK